MVPINFYSKKQLTIESSTYGSEFIALEAAQEMLDSLIYKLKMLGVPISGPVRIFYDKKSVVKSSTFPDSALKNKHCSIVYHKIREAVAQLTYLIYYEKPSTNLANLFAKVLSATKRESLIPAILTGG